LLVLPSVAPLFSSFNSFIGHLSQEAVSDMKDRVSDASKRCDIGSFPADVRRIEFRVGIHLGDVVEESDGDLMGDGVNVAARLEGIAEPGGICLSEDAYRQVRDRFKEEFIDLGEKELKNIVRPVRVFAIKTGSAGPASETHVPAQDKAGPPRLSIVVLPFANIGGDPEQECFVDGVTESLTTDLSRISGSFVIGRNTAFTYKGKHIDLKQVGRELNVRYGSVQRSGNRLRVNVQLIDAEIAFGEPAVHGSEKIAGPYPACHRYIPLSVATGIWQSAYRDRTGERVGEAACVPFLSANCAAMANPNATQNTQPAATKRSLGVSQIAFCCVAIDKSGGRSSNTFSAAKPKQFIRRQTKVAEEWSMTGRSWHV
jgi:TolB-like protein